MKFTYTLLITLLIISCAPPKKMLTPQEIKSMTTKQFETNKELVFKSAISLIQSEGYLVDDANKDTGLITAYKRIEVSKKISRRSKTTFYIEEFNPTLTEVKITFYEGTIIIKNDGYSKRAEEKESMLEDATIYNNWFNNLRAEIERRRALTN
jgi:hypothetical protein